MKLIDERIEYLCKTGVVKLSRLKNISNLYFREANMVIPIAEGDYSILTDGSIRINNGDRIGKILNDIRDNHRILYSTYTLFIDDTFDEKQLRNILLQTSSLYKSVEVIYHRGTPDIDLYKLRSLINDVERKIKLIVFIPSTDDPILADYELKDIIFVKSIELVSFLKKDYTPEGNFLIEIAKDEWKQLLHRENNEILLSFKQFDAKALEGFTQDLKDFFSKRETKEYQFEIINSILKIISYDGLIKNDIGYLLGNDFTKEYNNTCRVCWARNICWSSKSYLLFGSSPKAVIENLHCCSAIKAIIEYSISKMFQEKSGIFEKLKTKEISFDEFNLKLIN